MKGKNSKKQPALESQSVLLWTAVLALTVLRLSVATSGAMTESEAFLSVCAAHPAGGYVEGPAGAPLLLAFLHLLGGSGLLLLRWIGPLSALALSWCVWWIGRRVAPHRPALAFWSVLGVNFLPTLNVASLTMDGAMVTATLILLTIVSGWSACLFNAAKGSRSADTGRRMLSPWALFGVSLAVTTLFYQPVGWLLLAALAFCFVTQGFKATPWRGLIVSASLLALGWILPLSWNACHDWIQWSSVAPAFDSVRAGGYAFSLGPLVTVSVLMVPPLVCLAYAGRGWRWAVLLVALLMFAASSLLLLNPGWIPAGFPSPVGILGIPEAAQSISVLREARPDAHGEKSFLIASTSGLAALFGERIGIDYPERPGAPSVFAVESPSLNSSYALWPSYADAVGAGIKDNLYTEEKSASPFIGRNALYITTETKQELPQTITGAFGAVGLLKEVPLVWNGRQVTIRIYQCEDYRTLSL